MQETVARDQSWIRYISFRDCIRAYPPDCTFVLETLNEPLQNASLLPFLVRVREKNVDVIGKIFASTVSDWLECQIETRVLLR